MAIGRANGLIQDDSFARCVIFAIRPLIEAEAREAGAQQIEAATGCEVAPDPPRTHAPDCWRWHPMCMALACATMVRGVAP